MPLRELAKHAVRDACQAIGRQLSQEEQRPVAGIVERAMQAAIREAMAHCRAAATACCRHDGDMAHQIAAEIDPAHTALIANLSALG